jgi:hypothetical protein
LSLLDSRSLRLSGPVSRFFRFGDLGTIKDSSKDSKKIGWSSRKKGNPDKKPKIPKTDIHYYH